MIEAPNKDAQNEERASTAIRWFVRLRAEDLTEIDHDQFFDWLFNSQINQQAFAEILTLWDSLEVVKGLQFDERSALNLLQKNRNVAELRSNLFT